MSKEREVIFEMIEEREALVRAKHRSIDRLYEIYDSQAMVLGGYKVHEEINRLYDEILLLKMVLMAADNG